MVTRLRPSRSRIWSRLRNRHPIASVLSASELEQVFQQERARTDRNQRPFSMVVFLPAGDRPQGLGAMVQVLKRRMRVYDSVGQLDSRRIAMLLPETDSDGAWKLADDVLARLAEAGLPFNCEVYCYPADWARDRDRSRQRAHQLQLAESGAGAPSSESSSEPNAPAPDGDAATGTDGPVLRVVGPEEPQPHLGDLRAGPGRPVQDLSPLLVQPLPWAKRALDIVVSTSLLVLLSPLLIAVAILIKLTSEGPVLFAQDRAGLGGEPFQFYKFRSMYLNAEQRQAELAHRNIHRTGPVFKDPADPRITPVGRVLRRWSIDELPQLFNVLRGDMTLVGPRPPMLSEVEKYKPWQRRRLEVTGGLTCIWQVSGRSEVGFEDWVRMDIQYQEKRSLLLDVKLLFRTVGAVFSGRGAY